MFFLNFVPNKIVTFDDRDPAWMTEYIKTKIQQRDNIYRNYRRSSKNNQNFQYLKSVIDDISNIICKRKSDYYNQLAQKLIDPTTRCKTFWSILKTFVNGRKVPLIPPLNLGNKLVTDFKEKARLLMIFLRQNVSNNK